MVVLFDGFCGNYLCVVLLCDAFAWWKSVAGFVSTTAIAFAAVDVQLMPYRIHMGGNVVGIYTADLDHC